MYRYERDHLSGWAPVQAGPRLSGWAPIQSTGLGFSLKPPAWLTQLVGGAQKATQQAGTIITAANQPALPQTQMGTPANLNLSVLPSYGNEPWLWPVVIGGAALMFFISKRGIGR